MNAYFSAKCYFSYPDRKNDKGEQGYEQRIILFSAPNEDDALLLAEHEAIEYAAVNSATFLGFVEVFRLLDFNGKVEGASEVYSITMFDDPDEDEFLNNYYLTGGNTR